MFNEILTRIDTSIDIVMSDTNKLKEIVIEASDQHKVSDELIAYVENGIDAQMKFINDITNIVGEPSMLTLAMTSDTGLTALQCTIDSVKRLTKEVGTLTRTLAMATRELLAIKGSNEVNVH